jgi:hypothetical protein
MVSASTGARRSVEGNSAANGRRPNPFAIKPLGICCESTCRERASQTPHLSAIRLRFLLVAFSWEARLMDEPAFFSAGLWNHPEDYAILSKEGMMRI